MCLKVSSGKIAAICLGLNVLNLSSGNQAVIMHWMVTFLSIAIITWRHRWIHSYLGKKYMLVYALVLSCARSSASNTSTNFAYMFVKKIGCLCAQAHVSWGMSPQSCHNKICIKFGCCVFVVVDCCFFLERLLYHFGDTMSFETLQCSGTRGVLCRIRPCSFKWSPNFITFLMHM